MINAAHISPAFSQQDLIPLIAMLQGCTHTHLTADTVCGLFAHKGMHWGSQQPFKLRGG